MHAWQWCPVRCLVYKTGRQTIELAYPAIMTCNYIQLNVLCKHRIFLKIDAARFLMQVGIGDNDFLPCAQRSFRVRQQAAGGRRQIAFSGVLNW